MQGTENSALEFVEIREQCFTGISGMWFCKLSSKALPKENSHAINIWQSKQSNKRDTERLNIWLEILRILFLSVLVSSELNLMEAASRMCFFLSCPQSGL